MVNTEIHSIEKAAILLYVLGEEVASQVLKTLEEHEIQKVVEKMYEISTFPKERVDEVIREFYQIAGEDNPMAVNGNEYLKKILGKSLDPQKVTSILSSIEMFSNTEGLDFIKKLDPAMVSGYLRNEHPQTSALILGRLNPSFAGEILSKMPERSQIEIINRIANLQPVSPAVIKEVDEILRHQFRDLNSHTKGSIGGIKIVAEIMNQMPKSVEESILVSIEKDDPDLSSKIKEMRFTFDDLLSIQDRDIQLVLKDVSSDILSKALKISGEAMKEKIFKNMSERARDMLKDDIENMGPIKVKDAEKAQKDIMAVVKKLGDEGKIELNTKSEEDAYV